MIRRIFVATVSAVALAALMADVAGAFSRLEAICIKGARTRSKTSLKACRDDVAFKLRTDYEACLSDSTGCVGNCLKDQATCQSLFKPSLDLCRDGCKADNATASDLCGDAANPLKCVADAQYVLFTCNQACVAAIEPGIIDCNGTFNDCLQGCSNP
jgi:hypothetical protein